MNMETRKKEDVLHLYLGCEVMFRKQVRVLLGILKSENSVMLSYDNETIQTVSDSEIKPILRPLSDMSEEEAVECAKIIARRPPHFTAIENADITRHENSIDVIFIDKLDEVINIGNNGDALLYRHVDMNHRIIEQRCYGQADYFKYLLSKHFDLFALIEAGFAIDKTINES